MDTSAIVAGPGVVIPLYEKEKLVAAPVTPLPAAMSRRLRRNYFWLFLVLLAVFFGVPLLWLAIAAALLALALGIAALVLLHPGFRQPLFEDRLRVRRHGRVLPPFGLPHKLRRLQRWCRKPICNSVADRVETYHVCTRDGGRAG